MTPDRVVDAIDVTANCLPGLGSGSEDGAPDQFGFQGFEEGLDNARQLMQMQEAVYRRLVERVGHPSLVVHLPCTPDIQLQRIALRGRSQETGIERAYLVDLCAAINRRLEQLRSEAPDVVVVEVDTVRWTTPQILRLPLQWQESSSPP